MSQILQSIINSGTGTGPIYAIQGNSGSPLGPTGAGIISLIGTGVASVDPGGASIQNIYAPPLGIIWNVPDTSTPLGPMTINHGYVANGSSAVVEYTLPPTAAYGTVLAVVNVAFSFGWKIKQSSGQQIILGDVSTTLGATGFVESVGLGDSVILVCVVANTLWIAISVSGNPQGN